jgi:long-chain acyl-CoA synthetase
LQYTGGTTGVAKAAMLTHRNLVANALQVRAWSQNLAEPDGADIVMGVLPLFHIYAMTTVMNSSIRGGGTMILQPRFVVGDVLKGIDREHPHLLPGVPTMYLAINHAPNLTRYNLRSLKGAISGAAPLPREVQAQFEALTGARLIEGYGLTEASPVTHGTPFEGEQRSGSIGVPLPSTEAAIFDQETGTRQLPPGEVGELAVRGPQVMLGYWKRPDETARVLRDGWLFTGDLASIDAGGYFSVVDRKKDMIITGGMNVYPRDVEEPLYQHPKVKEAVAVGVPDARWGEAVKVYIVLRDGESATAQEIVEFCHSRMARYKVPKFVEFRPELPKNMIGKVLRRRLIEEELARSQVGTSRAS